ncbi:MAG: hypothetical protein AB1428_12045 [Bacteroidota bacterium]
MIKKFLVFFGILLIAVLFWFTFAIWTGLYSIYTFPPSKENPDGATLIVSRDEGEPMFNSPQYKKPPKKQEKTGGIGFGSVDRPKRPLSQRTIVELPYIDWAYQKSLEEPESE